MSQLIENAEELFRFTSTRPPDPAARPAQALELADDSDVPAWLADAQSQDYDSQLAQLEASWQQIAARPALAAFARLHAAGTGATAVDLGQLFPLVTMANTGGSLDALLTGLWKFYLQGLSSGKAGADQLKRSHQLIVLVSLTQAAQRGDIKDAAPALLRDYAARAIRLPAAFARAMQAMRETDMRQASAALLQVLEEQDSRTRRLLAELSGLKQLEQRVGDALELAAPDAIGLPDTTLRPAASAGPNGAPADMAHVVHAAADIGAAFHAQHPALIADLRTAGVPTFQLTGYQILDETRRMIAQRSLAAAARPASATFAPVSQPERLGIRALGVADLRMVRQVLVKYDRGELAHIDNTMRGETRERIHKRVQRIEESTFTLAEKERENTRDTQSTERFELRREAFLAARTVNERSDSISLSATYGDVMIYASAYTYAHRSADLWRGESVVQAREVVKRAVERVRELVVEQRYRSATLEVSETTRHKQATKDCNIIGKYWWVDKIYQAQVYNYGARAMYELMVPKPAALYKLLRARQHDTGPLRPELSAGDITETSWMVIGARHGVSLPSPPPTAITEYAQAIHPSKLQRNAVVSGVFNAAQALDQGYQPTLAGCSMSWYGVRDQCGVTASIGTRLFTGNADPASGAPFQHLEAGSGAVGFSASGWGEIHQYTVNFSLVWVRTPRALENWQQACHKVILDDYAAKRAAYLETAAGEAPDALSELQMRTIEKNELKRAILDIVKSSTGTATPAATPAVATGAAAREVRFVESAFEWDQMTYRFHPYFWTGAQEGWDASAFTQEGDSVFTAFLNAGYATAILPVRSGYEGAAALYIQTGLISELPVVPADDVLAGMNHEVTQRNALRDDGIAEGEAWLYRVPTSLVVLDDEATNALPDLAVSRVGM